MQESEPENPEAEAPAAPTAPKPPLWKDPWFRFAATFGLYALVSEVVYFAFALESDLFRRYLEILTVMSAWILEQLTTGIQVRGTVIQGDLFSVQIAPGCDEVIVRFVPSGTMPPGGSNWGGRPKCSSIHARRLMTKSFMMKM